MSERIRINGREFKPVTNSTLRHDIWTQAQIQRAGLASVAIAQGESPRDFAMRVFREATTNGDVFLLLGGLLMPAEQGGKDWTPRMAEQTAEFLGGVTSDADKAVVNAQIISALTSFFALGLSSLVIFQNSSTRAENPGGQPP